MNSMPSKVDRYDLLRRAANSPWRSWSTMEDDFSARKEDFSMKLHALQGGPLRFTRRAVNSPWRSWSTMEDDVLRKKKNFSMKLHALQGDRYDLPAVQQITLEIMEHHGG